MNKCPKCGTEFAGTFCPECGTKWLEKKTCPGCGRSLPGSAKFCTYCGKSFYAPPRPATKPKKKRSFKRWVSEHKKLFGFLIAAFVLVLILSVVIPIVIIHRHDGTYYLYSNEQYDYETYLILNGNSYTDETGYSCDVEFDGNQIKLYGEIFGIKDIIANGTIDGDVMRLKIMDTVVIYAKKDHVHKYEQKTIQEPTCNQEGIVAKVCQTCGFQMRDEIEKIAPLGHDFQNHVCTRCGVNSNILLEYSMVADGSGYIVTGLGSCPEKEIIIPNEYRGIPVTSIGAEAFSGCDTLLSVTIGSNVTSIGESAFHGCERLASITIPDSVTSIGDSAFYGCSGLTSITIPDSVTSIGDSAFENCYGLTLVTIPDSVTSIGYAAFGSCDGLTEITIPDSVTSIGGSAFEDCSKLTSVIWNAENCTTAGGDFYYVFRNCTSLETVTFGTNVKTIPAYAFDGCSGLTEITIPDSVTSIGDYAFAGCSGLTEITIPDSVTSIGFNAFGGCSGLTEITIPDSVTSIGDWAFAGCSGLALVEIGSGVTSIGAWVFCDCSGLTSVKIGNNVTSIENMAFGGCSGLTEITIPDSVTSIGNYAFYECSGLTEITIPNSVTGIGREAFEYCSGLTSVTIPNSVTSIGVSAFRGCSALTSIKFNGTTDEWKAIKKHSDWKNGSPIQEVVCTNGTLKGSDIG